MMERLQSTGEDGVLRLQYQGGSEELSCLHDTKYTEPADSLHSLGKELSIYVWSTLLYRELVR